MKPHQVDGNKKFVVAPSVVAAAVAATVSAVAIIAAAVWLATTRSESLGPDGGQPQQTVEAGDIYFVQGHLTKMESPLNEKMIAHASNRFSYIYETYLEPENIHPYLSVIPDKNYYLTEDEQSRALDYDALIAKVAEENPFMEYIDITDLLSLDDFYVTDSHWRQEKIVDVADRIAEVISEEPGDGAPDSQETGASSGKAWLSDAYETCRFEEPFYGAYYTEGEERVGADTVYYLDSETLRACTVSLVGEDGEAAMYDLEKGRTDSPYDLFLSGTAAVLTIENPNAAEDKKLIVFRDSFGSSLVPLLVAGYHNITLIDTRYVQSAALGQYVDFSGADVLFLYSSLLLNNSMGMK
jgi:hypothetical protein